MIIKKSFLSGLLLFFMSASANSQIIGALQLDRLNLLDVYGPGARPSGLGGAYTAVSDDGFGLLYNPAGLAQMKKKEISFGITHSSLDMTFDYSGNSTTLPVSSTGIGHLSFAYPYPTYRGSLVLGFGIFRVGSSGSEYIKSAYRSDINGRIENTFNQDGTIYQYRFGAGLDISPGISLGGNLVVWDESAEFIEELYFEGVGDSSYIFTDDGSAGLDGFSLELGFLLRLTEGLRAGLKISSPVWISYDGEAYNYYEGSFPDGSLWEEPDDFYYIEDEYTLPMKFRGGLSYQFRNLLLTADAEYCDYSQTKYNGKTIYNELDRTSDILKEALDIYLGIEVALPYYPVKFRGGYAHISDRFAGHEEIAYFEEDGGYEYIVSEWGLFGSTPERDYFSFGVSGLIDKVLKVDLGLTFAEFERETDYLNDKTEFTEFSISTAYRF